MTINNNQHFKKRQLIEVNDRTHIIKSGHYQNLTKSANMETKVVSHFQSEKAGMKAVDKAAVSKIVQELTKGTPKYRREQQLLYKRKEEVSVMMRRIEAISTEEMHLRQIIWATRLEAYEERRDLTRYWAHFDFDMFYVACELLDRPQLKDKPCAVGGTNSVLCTANYEARNYGVRSAMPTFIAMKICPQLVLIPPDFSKYKHYSEIFRRILSEYDDNLESQGLDEAYIDLTDLLAGKTIEEQQQFMQGIRKKIFDQTKLTVSCGVGTNKMLAKIASQERKPNDQFILSNDKETILKFMSSKAIRKIPGIGPVNQFYLKELGIETAAQILTSLAKIAECFSDGSAEFYAQSALGIASNIHSFHERKSVGRSETFRPTASLPELEAKLKSLCEQVHKDLVELSLLTSNVVLSIQSEDYEKKDRTFNISNFTQEANILYGAVSGCLKNYDRGRIRLLGVRCTHIIDQSEHKRNLVQQMLQTEREGGETLDGFTLVENTLGGQGGQRGSYICPACDQLINCKGNMAMFNRHLDSCLNQKTQQKETPPLLTVPRSMVEEKADSSSIDLGSRSTTIKTVSKMPRSKVKASNPTQSSIRSFIKPDK